MTSVSENEAAAGVVAIFYIALATVYAVTTSRAAEALLKRVQTSGPDGIRAALRNVRTMREALGDPFG